MIQNLAHLPSFGVNVTFKLAMVVKCFQDAYENPIMFNRILPHFKIHRNIPIANPIIKMVVKNASELSLADSEQIEGVISS